MTADIDPPAGDPGATPFATPEVGFKHLLPRCRYVVVKPFTDFDGEVHGVGESWIFLGSGYVPYDAGLSLYVTVDGGRRQQVRLQWDPDQQAAIIEGLEDYIRPVSSDPPQD